MADNIKTVCKNYSIITRCEFMDNDDFSVKLVEYYKKSVVIMNDSPGDESDKMRQLDYVMRKYVEDYNFSKKLKNDMDLSTVLSNNNCDYLLSFMSSFLEKYNNDKKEKIATTRWI